jgi:two-component system KDP operon response regulator KdpE
MKSPYTRAKRRVHAGNGLKGQTCTTRIYANLIERRCKRVERVFISMVVRPQSPLMGGPGVQPLVLVIGDEPRLGRSLVSTLAIHGFRTLQCGTRASALTKAIGHEPDFILFDVHAGWADAVGVAVRVREQTSAPIVVLLDRAIADDGGRMLDAGANDYIVRPFRMADLLARMRVWMRQTARARGPRALAESHVERFRIDAERRILVVDGREVHVTPLECKLLLALARSPGRAMTEEQILAALWGSGGATRVQYLRTHVRQLRQKMEGDPAKPRHLVSETGGAYKLKLG